MIDLLKNSRYLRYYSKYYGENYIVVQHGHTSITNYELGDNRQFEKMLSIWRPNIFKLELLGGVYIKELKEFRVPRGLNISIIAKYFPKHKVVVDNDFFNSEKLENIELKVGPRSEIQLIAIGHMLAAPPFQRNAQYTQQMITLDTGEGKSYSTIAVIVSLKAKAIIIAPTTKIAEQWIDYYKSYTNVNPDRLMLVSGQKSCEEIYEGKHKDKVLFVFISKTLSEYMNFNPYYKIEKMLESTGAKVKVIDEVHRNMRLNVMLDCFSNFRINYYLTATDGRAEDAEDRLFQKLHQNMPKTSGLKQEEEYHINVLVRKYKWQPSTNACRHMNMSKLGLNANIYEHYLMTEGWKTLKRELDTILLWIDKKNVDNNKLLILTTTIEGIEKMQKYLQERYPDKKITIYHSKLKAKEQEDMKKGDIVIATDKGAGYGTDIPGAQFMINLVTYSNKNGAKQFKGRLRKIENHEVYYFELVNFGYGKTYKQFKHREDHLKQNAKGSLILYTN